MPYAHEKVDPVEVKKLAALYCTVKEISSFFGVSPDTIQRNFAAEVEAGREAGRRSLRKAQYDAALRGNVTMLIWLGRQLLGQTDKIEMNMTFNVPKLQVIEADTQAKTVLEIAPPSADNNSI